jgi:hypothetical protein
MLTLLPLPLCIELYRFFQTGFFLSIWTKIGSVSKCVCRVMRRSSPTSFSFIMPSCAVRRLIPAPSLLIDVKRQTPSYRSHGPVRECVWVVRGFKKTGAIRRDGCATALTDSHWIPFVVASLHSCDSTFCICGGQSDSETKFSSVISIFLCHYPPIFRIHSLSGRYTGSLFYLTNLFVICIRCCAARVGQDEWTALIHSSSWREEASESCEINNGDVQ